MSERRFHNEDDGPATGLGPDALSDHALRAVPEPDRPSPRPLEVLAKLEGMLISGKKSHSMGRLAIGHFIDRIEKYERVAQLWFVAYTALGIISTVSAIATPIMLGVSLGDDSASTRWLSFGFAVLAIVSLSFERAFHVHDHRRGDRSRVELLKRESVTFALDAGEYTDLVPHVACRVYVERFEGLCKPIVESDAEVLDQTLAG